MALFFTHVCMQWKVIFVALMTLLGLYFQLTAKWQNYSIIMTFQVKSICMDDWIETKISVIVCPWSDATQTPRPSSCDFRCVFNFDFFFLAI